MHDLCTWASPWAAEAYKHWGGYWQIYPYHSTKPDTLVALDPHPADLLVIESHDSDTDNCWSQGIVLCLSQSQPLLLRSRCRPRAWPLPLLLFARHTRYSYSAIRQILIHKIAIVMQKL